jgi:hypothetical protein
MIIIKDNESSVGAVRLRMKRRRYVPIHRDGRFDGLSDETETHQLIK